jgi:tetratricopeptide (TPR) repeat protein
MSLPVHVAKRLEAALGYLDLDLPEEAWRELDQIEQPHHELPEIMFGRVDVRMRQKRWAEAIKLADRLCAEHPEHHAAYISRSFCLHSMGRTLDARQKLKEAPRSIAHVPIYHYNLACYECQLGNLPEARRVLQHAFELHSNFLEIAAADKDLEPLWPELEQLSREARREKTGLRHKELTEWSLLFDHGSHEQRRTAMENLIALAAEDFFTDRLASYQPEVVQLASHGLWECWLNEAGDDARQQINKGIKAMSAGELREAEEVFSDMLMKHPLWPEASNKLATVYYLQGRFEESMALCRKVVSVKPNHFGAWSGLAMSLIKLERWSEALPAADQALLLQPHSTFNQEIVALIKNQLAI